MTLAVLFTGLLAGALASSYVVGSLPTMDGKLDLPGLRHPVDVHRDPGDVTHILGADPRDTWMALGYVHAQERTWQLDFNRRIMRGRLSEVLGPATLETDILMRTLGIRQAAQAQYERLPDEAKAALQAYSAGVNAFHSSRRQALSPEFLLLGIDPAPEARAGTYWDAVDSVGWSLMMALDLGGNWGNEMARLSALQAIDTDRLWELFRPYPGEKRAATADLAALYRQLGVFSPTAGQVSASHQAPASGWLAQAGQDIREWAAELGNIEGKGSNNWVVSGERSATGKPLLANDPHLGLSAPAIWYFARLKAPAANGIEGMDVIGATLPGTPFVVLGRTDGVAWGFTNTGPDVQDIFIEALDPADAGRYRVPSPDAEPRWQRFDTRQEVIRVKGQADVVHTVRQSRHGPVISDVPGRTRALVDTGRYALALRWSALDADNGNVLATLRANRAQSVPALTEAFRDFHAPMQNALMADRSGRIAYKAIGKVPLRHPDNDIRGVAPSPGWDVRYDWQGWLPFDQTPGDDGQRGWIATANQRIHGPDYPHFLTQDWAPPYRQERIEALLRATPRHDLDSFQAMHGDLLSEATRRLLPVLLKTASSHPLAGPAMQTLQGFDGQMRADSAAALIYSAWIDELTREVVGARLGRERFEGMYGKRLFRSAMEDILARDDRFWCGDAGCAAASARALDRALERLQREQGAEVSRWQWGRAHPAISVHRPLSNVKALAPWFEVRSDTGGDPFTVNVGQYHLDKADAPYANRHAASLRAVYDLADPERSVFIYQTGQSGNVFSPRYRDMATTWAAVGYRPLQLSPDRWVSSLRLQP
ncbi:MAG: penicillin acylase family protein [Gammaproteobacteria bacterium]